MVPDTLIIATGLFLLSIASGMLGLVVACAAVPVSGTLRRALA